MRTGCSHSVGSPRARRWTDILASEAFAAFERRLAGLGYVTGTNLVVEHRRAEGRAERLPTLAAELVRLKPDLIVMVSGPDGGLALKRATTTLPVIFGAVEWDPIATGLATTLVRPGGNFTRLGPARSGAGRQASGVAPRKPAPRDAGGVLWQRIRAETQLKAVREAVGPLKIQLIPLEIREVPGDLDEAMLKAARQRAEAVLVLGSPAFYPERKPAGGPDRRLR